MPSDNANSRAAASNPCFFAEKSAPDWPAPKELNMMLIVRKNPIRYNVGVFNKQVMNANTHESKATKKSVNSSIPFSISLMPTRNTNEKVPNTANCESP